MVGVSARYAPRTNLSSYVFFFDIGFKQVEVVVTEVSVKLCHGEKHAGHEAKQDLAQEYEAHVEVQGLRAKDPLLAQIGGPDVINAAAIQRERFKRVFRKEFVKEFIKYSIVNVWEGEGEGKGKGRERALVIIFIRYYWIIIVWSHPVPASVSVDISQS